MRPGRYAAIDIGTVTCRMLVADVLLDGSLATVAKEYAVTNLGEGVDESHVLAKEAICRVTKTIDGYLKVLADLDATDNPVMGITVMATSAARDADNADEFATMLNERGLDLAVIPGNVEAALSFMGASSSYAGTKRQIMVVDVGGGSTEIALGHAGKAPRATHSFNIGCRRVTERFWDGYPPSAEAVRAARAWMVPQFEEWRATLPDVQDVHMVAVAGTATSIVAIRDGIEPYDSARVDGAVVTSEDLRRIEGEFLDMTLAQIESVRGLDPKRAPVITAGMVILEEVMRAMGIGAFRASESDILDGMVMYNASHR